jgi:chemotaxis response regulator CheB
VLKPGEVTVGRPGWHLRVSSRMMVQLIQPQFPGQLHVPSVDQLFESVSEAFANEAIGVLLTGMGEDGAKGMRALRRRGAFTLAQDEATCVVYGMPKAAVDADAVEAVLPIEAIGPALAHAARLTAPQEPVRIQPAGPHVAPEASSMSGKILIVDDSPVILASVRTALEAGGFKVVTTDNPLMVSALVIREKPSVVLMDVNMPNVQGDRAATLMKRVGVGEGTILLLHSDLPDAELKTKVDACGATGYIRKGLADSSLVREIWSWIGRK